MILSSIEYGDIIYSGTSSSNLQKNERLFNRGLRICLGFNYKVDKDELCADCNQKLGIQYYIMPWFLTPINLTTNWLK